MLDARFYAFILAILLYAVFSSPTPDNPGLVEVIMAVFLVFAFGAQGAQVLNLREQGRAFWFKSAQALLVVGGGIGAAVAVLYGAPVGLILRDGLAFLFLCLPVFACGIVMARPHYFRIFVAAIVFCGFVFVARVLGNVAGFNLSRELLYLANAPSVLFAALFTIGASGAYFIRRWSMRAAIGFGLCAGISLACFGAMAIDLQRAFLGYAGLYITVMIFLGLCFYPRRMAVLVLVFLGLSWPLAGEVYELFGALMAKTQLYGLNSRLAEFAAVWHELQGAEIIFGKGWGATFESPAVAEIRVNFTHNLFSAALLKTGLVGMTLSGFYIYAVFRIAAGLCLSRPVLGLALAGPFLICALLYASYKSLDFGLVLTLIIAAGSLHPARGYSNQKA